MIRSNIFLLLIFTVVSCNTQNSADVVIFGGTIYTADNNNSVAEAVAVTGNKITFVGTRMEAQEYINENTRVIDLKGKIVTPGFIEGHGHFMGLGYTELNLDLANVKNFDEMVEKVKAAVSKASPGEWIVGRGWHQDKWDVTPDKMVKGFPLHHKLSEVSPNNCVS